MAKAYLQAPGGTRRYVDFVSTKISNATKVLASCCPACSGLCPLRCVQILHSSKLGAGSVHLASHFVQNKRHRLESCGAVVVFGVSKNCNRLGVVNYD